MISFLKSSKYDRERNKFIRNNTPRAKSLVKVLKLFVNNPTHPSLRLEKLGGTDIWTIRIDKANRVFFAWQDKETVILIDIGKHDKYRQY